MVEQSTNLGHRIQLHLTKPSYMDTIVRERTEIELHPSNVNVEDGFSLIQSYKALICSLKHDSRLPSHESRPGFSEGPRRSLQVPSSGRTMHSLRALTSFHSDVPHFFRCLCCLIPHSTPVTHFMSLSDKSLRCPTRSYSSSRRFFSTPSLTAGFV